MITTCPSVDDSVLLPVWSEAIVPAMRLLPPAMNSPEAWHQLLATTLQEARGTERVQIVSGGKCGPARGLWQFERAGGVLGVLNHPNTRRHAWNVCEALKVACTSQTVWVTLQHNDVLAAALARLLLWSDPLPLPHRDSAELAWKYYVRNWRPGKPHRHTWDEFHARARAFVYGD